MAVLHLILRFRVARCDKPDGRSRRDPVLVAPGVSPTDVARA